MKPTFVGGVWRKPQIQARQRKELQNYFNTAGVPWIYSKETPDIHTSSTYNRRPKGTAFSRNYESKLAMIRKNLSQQPDRLMKLRTDRNAAKPYTDDEQTFVGVLKALAAEAGAAKYGRKKKVTNDDDGPIVEQRKGSPVKKTTGASKGGQLSKKEREVMGMATDIVGGKKEEEDK